MSETKEQVKYTPGPWIVAGTSGTAYWDVGTPDEDGTAKPNVARVWAVGVGANGTGEANARLIAAAPELLEACGPFRFEVPKEISDDESLGVIRGIHIYAGELRRLNAACAKAEGRQ